MGYPLEPWLMIPLPNETPGSPRFAYNEALCKTRNCIERTFGVMKMTWRCLSRYRALQYKPAFAGKIVNACTVLHNMKRSYSEPFLENSFQNYPLIDEIDYIPQRQPLLSVARRIQNQIIEQHFS